MEKLKIKQAVLVEGRYDKNKLTAILDADIFVTNGFSVFSNSEKCDLLKRIADERGIIIFTDSDPAGFVIRNKLKGMLPKDKVTHIYAPSVLGKEARKKQSSKAGILGVEGLSADMLSDVFKKFGVVYEGSDNVTATEKSTYTKADLYEKGLCGRDESAAARDEFCRKNSLPFGMSPSALLEAINILGLEI